MTTRRGLLAFLGLAAAAPMLPKIAAAAEPAVAVAAPDLSSTAFPVALQPPYSYVWSNGDVGSSTTLDFGLEHGDEIPMVLVCTVTDSHGNSCAAPIDVSIEPFNAEVRFAR